MNCAGCGAQVPDGTKFCPHCGAAAGGAPQQQSAAPQAGGAAQWYLYINNQNHGPYGTADIINYIKGGRIPAGVYVWREGMQGWQQAGTVSEFAAAAQGGGAPPAQQQPQQQAAGPQDDTKFDQKARKKYERAKAKREQAEARAEAKKQQQKAVEEQASVKVMKTREGKPIQFFEGVLFVLLLLVVAFPAGMVFLWYSRKFSTFGKLFTTMVFGTVWGLLIFSVLSPKWYTPFPMEHVLIESMPQGFSRETYEAIPYNLPDVFVFEMLGDADLGCEEKQEPIIGSITSCKWEQDFDDGSIVITVDFWKARTVYKEWQEFDPAGEPIE